MHKYKQFIEHTENENIRLKAENASLADEVREETRQELNEQMKDIIKRSTMDVM